MFTSNNVYPRLVQEFYANMKVIEVSQSCPILKTTVLDVEIRVDSALISVITQIPVTSDLRIPFPDSVDPPSIKHLRMCFDPQGHHVWEFKIGWLDFPHRLLAQIVLSNLWSLARHNTLTICRARFLYAIIQGFPFCMCKHLVMTMIEMQNDSQVGLPYGYIVTRII
jgi:hypothetical protein